MPKVWLQAPKGGWRRYLVAATRSERKGRYHEYLSSHSWWQKRCKAIKRAGGKCALCPNRKRLTVHHLTYDRVGQEWPEDMRVVCWPCHQAQHDGHPTVIPMDERTRFVAARLFQKRSRRAAKWAASKIKAMKRAEKRRGHMQKGGIGVPVVRTPKPWAPDNSPSIKDRQPIR